jgi:hypothetical protein
MISGFRACLGVSTCAANEDFVYFGDMNVGTNTLVSEGSAYAQDISTVTCPDSDLITNEADC